MAQFAEHFALMSVVASVAFIAPALATEARYTCSDGSKLTAQFSPPDTAKGSVALTFGTGRELKLPQVLSADGGRYANGRRRPLDQGAKRHADNERREENVLDAMISRAASTGAMKAGLCNRGGGTTAPLSSHYRTARSPLRRAKNFVTAYLILDLFLFLPYSQPAERRTLQTSSECDRSSASIWVVCAGEHNMNIAGQVAVTLAALIGFGRLFLAEEGDSHRLSGVLILAGLVGKVALSI